ncbi:MAG: hypothetical protein GQ474_01605 [Sulfurimonas sp.]|nr:hypothetical protein [Sulfurimonas sp.]
MTVAPNSLRMYYSKTYTKTFSLQRYSVLAHITHNPNLTRQDLSDDKDLGLPINSICGRVKELLDAGLIREVKDLPRNKLVSNFEGKGEKFEK